MSDMKCPVCKGELYIFKSSTQDAIVCADCGFDGNTKLWQELIRTRKALEVATRFIKGISSTIINDCDNQYVVLGNFKKFAQDTLNQIKTALEQKE